MCQIGQSQEILLDSLRSKVEFIENSKDYDASDENYIDLLNKLGQTYQYKNIDSLRYFSEKAYTLSDKLKYPKGKGIALATLSQYKFYVGKNAEGLKLLNSSLIIAKQNENIELQIRTLRVLGNQQFNFGNHAAALKSYLSAIDLATASKDISRLSVLKESVASLYVSQKDYAQSLEIYKEVESLNKQLGNVIYIAESKSNIADIYVKLNDLKNAAVYIDSSMEIFKKYKSYDWLAYCYNVKGDIYLKQDNPKLALHWYDKAIVLHEDLSDDRYKAPLLNSISEAYNKLRNYEKAEEFAKQSLAIATKLSLLEDSIKSYELLYEISKEKHISEDALAYHEKYKLLSDSISRKENLNSLGVLKTKLEFEKQQRDAAIANQKEKAKQNVYMYLSLIALAILGLIIFLLRKQSKTRKLFNNELRLKTAALEKREEELSAINNTKDKLFSIIGHDLRGPINALASILSLFKDNEIEPEEFLTFIPKVKSDVDAISFTLNNLLSWGRTQMTGSITEPCEINLNALINENINLLHEIADNKSIIINNNITSNCNVWSDKNQIDVVIRNLLSNALKFTHKNGSINLRAVQKDSYIEVSVEDTGVGMEEHIQNQIFSPEKTLITTYGTADEKGTGLGLSLCKEMVENNGGKIWVESVPGKGSIFYFTLPKTKSIQKAV